MNSVATSKVETSHALARSAPRFSSLTSLLWIAAGAAALPALGCSVAASATDDGDTAVEASEMPVGDLTLIDRPLGDRPPRPFPPPPPPPNPEELMEISAGGYHTCVRKRNGNTYCWGLDDNGQSGGLPTATCVSAPNKCIDKPTRVYSFGGFTTATQLDAGYDHTCALDAAGKGYCWGGSGYGQIGAGFYGSVSEPIAVSGGLTFTSISAGTYSSCGTTSAGVHCWGNSAPGPTGWLGAGPTPTLVYSATGLSPIGVSVGYLHVCAQWVSGTYRETNCWGGNSYGQSGSTASAFAWLGQGPYSVGTAALRVTTQNNFTCVDQPGPNPSVQCFGSNNWGQLGNGIYVNNSDGQTVGGQTLPGGPPPLPLHGVSTGFDHACALDPNGAAYCWGNGYWGQLGHGLSALSPMPAAVVGGLTFRAIAAGYQHTCAIGTNNHIYCWGSNYTGQLGTQYKSTGQPYTNGWISTPVQAIDP